MKPSVSDLLAAVVYGWAIVFMAGVVFGVVWLAWDARRRDLEDRASLVDLDVRRRLREEANASLVLYPTERRGVRRFGGGRG